MEMWGVKLVFLAMTILYTVFWLQESRARPPEAPLSPRGRASRRMAVICAGVLVFLMILLR